ncbi:hypothetical protein GKZ89_16845 [Bacillus mangrovi]|uniref:Lipoprotein n=1 Tax=Metabacillus mangrovi TaxID=1491830 RepID=A0A7X2S7I3_9BACI|nr:hypothetical protein [Metabacillus mangrovi]MTH55074.1 hypothetical protein [Metabacillus mangrovi]
MRIKRCIYALVSLLIIGGCELSTESAQQETPALKDEFTKEDLTSAKEVEKGFYEFKSKTGGYTMLLPVEAVISKGFLYSVLKLIKHPLTHRSLMKTTPSPET